MNVLYKTKSISDSLLETKEKMNELLASHTGRTIEEIGQAISFNHFLYLMKLLSLGYVTE